LADEGANTTTVWAQFLDDITVGSRALTFPGPSSARSVFVIAETDDGIDLLARNHSIHASTVTPLHVLSDNFSASFAKTEG